VEAAAEDANAGHGEHAADPDAFLKVPATHAEHAPPSAPVKPGLHWQAVGPGLAAEEELSAGQSTQAWVAAFSYWPGGHCTQTAPFSPAYPASQTQAVADVEASAEDAKAPHCVQLSEPSVGLKVNT